MDYAAMLRQLFGARRGGIALELERVRCALAELGHPEARIPVSVHVGGTNGKGSTCAFVESILRALGVRTGLFTSPHLSRFAERFRIAGQPAADADILAAYQRVHAVLPAVERASHRPLTFFERVTAMGLLLFAEAGVEIAILEVGLGGRFDATNSVRADVACVTGVAFDHQDYLGDDLQAIAAAKGGIFKSGQRAVIGCAGRPEAVPWLVEHAQRAQVAALTTLDAAAVDRLVPAGWSLALAGRHQRDNAACALAIIDQLQALSTIPRADSRSLRDGLASAFMPGRLEQLGQRPLVVADGAHNPHGARVLARAIAQWPSRWPSPRALVLGVSAGKDAAGIVRALRPVFAGPRDSLVLTQADNPRSLAVDDLHSMVAPHWTSRVQAIADPVAALEHARAQVGPQGAVAVAGSLFLVGDVRRHLLGEPADPIALSDPP